jgi:hypothetical protein
MQQYDKQITRIKAKLLTAKHTDKALKVFGADNHRYYVNKPIANNGLLEFEKSIIFSCQQVIKHSFTISVTLESLMKTQLPAPFMVFTHLGKMPVS